jgi:hypothetical protein
MRTTILAAALTLLAACATKEPAPEPAPKSAEPAPAAAAQPEAPKAPPPPPPAAEPAKRKTMALGLPAPATLKDELGFSPKQVKACRDIYAGYKPKLDEAAAKLKAATDKKAANKEVAPLKSEVLAKLREVCTDDAQKSKFDQATAKKKKT